MRDQIRSHRASAKTGGETGRCEVAGTLSRYFSLFLKAAILRLFPNAVSPIGEYAADNWVGLHFVGSK